MASNLGPDSSAALPLRDYNRLTHGELADSILSLTAHELHQLLAYEWVHAQRDGVLGMLRARLTELGTGVAPSGTPSVFIPEQAGSPENLPVMPRIDGAIEGTEQGRPAL
ncbi:hypothetical protein [Kutzneria sp. 744]|uniref:hypothetical protein n=1 Tax=Kutzneria sp. (strain 744) TaxID=345341 RepID=UPI0003EECBCF|nr:hypothetical protein [Kutzneria sp. 744]EWM18152.1 hypothetical protein KUTG_08456 [Kutzneria sp. 744]